VVSIIVGATIQAAATWIPACAYNSYQMRRAARGKALCYSPVQPPAVTTPAQHGRRGQREEEWLFSKSKAAKQQSSKAAKQQSSKAAKQQSSKAAKQQSSKAGNN
jgi:hypothetical protein